jgi:hypothetical protein
MSTNTLVNKLMGLTDDLIGGSSLMWRYHHQVRAHHHSVTCGIAGRCNLVPGQKHRHSSRSLLSWSLQEVLCVQSCAGNGDVMWFGVVWCGVVWCASGAALLTSGS